MDDGILNKERILWEHGKDAFCKEQIPGTNSSRCKFFLDDDGVTYRCQTNDRHQLVVSKVLIHAVVKAKHDPIYIVHPGMKRTFNFPWLVVARYAEVHTRLCQEMRRMSEAKGGQRICSPTRRSEGTNSPFQVTSMDITGPCLITPCRNQCLPTFIDCINVTVEAKTILTRICKITVTGSAPLG